MQNNNQKASNLISNKMLKWQNCGLIIRRTNPNNSNQESYQNIQAEVDLQSDEIQEPFNPTIQFQKDFYFHQSYGFYWKKEYYLPKFRVKLQEIYYQLLKSDEQITRIYCDLSIVYPTSKNNSVYLQQIKTQGNKIKHFNQKGQVLYQKIKVQKQFQTLYNNKFSFLITICASSIEQNKIILKSLISSTFSIKCKRINSKNKQETSCFMQLVSPKAFKQPPINHMQNQSQQNLRSLIKIVQSLKSCNYLAKKLQSKHPFYMVYHFKDVFNIYFNSCIVQNITQLLNITSNSNSQTSKIISTDFNISKKPIFTYAIKKTKKIKKTVIQNSNITLQTTTQKQKKKLIIQAKVLLPQQFEYYDKKLLLITFQDQFINALHENQLKQQDQNFLQELHAQINSLNSIFMYWTQKLFLKIDLMKTEKMCPFWRSVNHKNLFKAYKCHYKTIKTILIKS